MSLGAEKGKSGQGFYNEMESEKINRKSFSSRKRGIHMKDQLVKALVLNEHVRVYAARTTDLVREAQRRFSLPPTATAALGRVLSVATIMGSMLKSDQELLTINLQGNGPAGGIVVDAEANGDVRGFVANPQVDLPPKADGHLDVGGFIGSEGFLTVTKDMHMQDNWSGTVELQSGEIGLDFAYYFTVSEQTPTAVSVGVRVGTDGVCETAGALVIQMLPGADDTDISICEHVLSGLRPMSEIIEEYDDASMADFVKDIFEDARILETRDVHYRCTCSRESTSRVLSTLSADQLEKMIEEDHGADVTCNFCNETYHFDEDDLRKILEAGQKKLEQEEKNLEETSELEAHVVSDQGN